MGVVSMLNFINNKLDAAGLDLNNITGITLDPAATKKGGVIPFRASARRPLRYRPNRRRKTGQALKTPDP